jgi:hypothetical protein
MLQRFFADACNPFFKENDIESGAGITAAAGYMVGEIRNSGFCPVFP